MEIIFKEDSKKKLTFKDVKDKHLFINDYGCLAIKVSADEYAKLANENKRPDACYYCNVASDMEVRKIFPEIERIEF